MRGEEEGRDGVQKTAGVYGVVCPVFIPWYLVRARDSRCQDAAPVLTHGWRRGASPENATGERTKKLLFGVAST